MWEGEEIMFPHKKAKFGQFWERSFPILLNAKQMASFFVLYYRNLELKYKPQ